MLTFKNRYLRAMARIAVGFETSLRDTAFPPVTPKMPRALMKSILPDTHEGSKSNAPPIPVGMTLLVTAFRRCKPELSSDTNGL